MTAFKKNFCFYPIVITYHVKKDNISHFYQGISYLKLVLIVLSNRDGLCNLQNESVHTFLM